MTMLLKAFPGPFGNNQLETLKSAPSCEVQFYEPTAQVKFYSTLEEKWNTRCSAFLFKKRGGVYLKRKMSGKLLPCRIYGVHRVGWRPLTLEACIGYYIIRDITAITMSGK